MDGRGGRKAVARSSEGRVREYSLKFEVWYIADGLNPLRSARSDDEEAILILKPRLEVVEVKRDRPRK